MATNPYPSDPVPREAERTSSQQGHDGSTTQSVKEQGREKAEQAAERARRSATEQVGRQKERATKRLGRMSDALRSTSDNLRSREEEQVARYVDRAAGQIDRLSGYLRERNVDELVYETREFARREPALFLGGAALLGMLGARFFRSSSPDYRAEGPTIDDRY